MRRAHALPAYPPTLVYTPSFESQVEPQAAAHGERPPRTPAKPRGDDDDEGPASKTRVVTLVLSGPRVWPSGIGDSSRTHSPTPTQFVITTLAGQRRSAKLLRRPPLRQRRPHTKLRGPRPRPTRRTRACARTHTQNTVAPRKGLRIDSTWNSIIRPLNELANRRCGSEYVHVSSPWVHSCF